MNIRKSMGIVALVGVVWGLNIETRCKPECTPSYLRPLLIKESITEKATDTFMKENERSISFDEAKLFESVRQRYLEQIVARHKSDEQWKCIDVILYDSHVGILDPQKEDPYVKMARAGEPLFYFGKTHYDMNTGEVTVSIPRNIFEIGENEDDILLVLENEVFDAYTKKVGMHANVPEKFSGHQASISTKNLVQELLGFENEFYRMKMNKRTPSNKMLQLAKSAGRMLYTATVEMSGQDTIDGAVCTWAIDYIHDRGVEDYFK